MLCRVLGFLSLSFTLLAGTEETQRIAELEARVSRLERLLEQALARSAAPAANDAAARILADAPPAPSAPAIPSSPPPPPAGPTSSRIPQELLPDLGKIGSTVRFDFGAHSGPYGLGKGTYFGGAIELPLAKAPGGRWSYELTAGLTQSSRTLPVVSNVAQVANLAVLGNLFPGNPNNVGAALSGSGAAPFPVRYDAKWNLQMLQLMPFGMKYTNTRLDRLGLRPFAGVGLGLYAVLTNQKTASGLRLDADLPADLRAVLGNLFSTQSPFAGSLLGGQIAAGQALADRRLPAGQGGVEIGAQGGAGIEYRLRRGFSTGVEVRYHRLSSGVGFFTFTTRGGFHF